MTWLVFGIAAAALVVLHAIAWKRASRAVLPTARFVPSASLPRRSRRIVPSDLGLLALRLLALLLATLALVAPPARPRADALARVVVVDGSRAVASAAERADIVRGLLGDAAAATTLLVFDSTVRATSAQEIESLGTAPVTGRLPAALVLAGREATRLRDRYRRVDLLVVSPVVEEEWSPAIGAIIRASGAAVRWIRLSAAPAPDVSGPDGGVPPVESPLGAAGRNVIGSAPRGVRVREGPPTADDSAFARDGGMVASFPPAVDTVAAPQALFAGRHVATGGFVRRPTLEGRAIAWWSDGATAAVEQSLGRGCLRDVGIALPVRGDEMLRPAFSGVLRDLLAPCDTPRLTAVPASMLPVSPNGSIAPDASNAWGRALLLLLALAALVAELVLRRRFARGSPAPAATLAQ